MANRRSARLPTCGTIRSGGLEYLRRAGATPDERVDEAIDVPTKRDSEGGAARTRYPGEMPIEMGRGRGPAERGSRCVPYGCGLVFSTLTHVSIPNLRGGAGCNLSTSGLDCSS